MLSFVSFVLRSVFVLIIRIILCFALVRPVCGNSSARSLVCSQVATVDSDGVQQRLPGENTVKSRGGCGLGSRVDQQPYLPGAQSSRRVRADVEGCLSNLSVCLPVCVLVCLSACLSAYLFVCMLRSFTLSRLLSLTPYHLSHTHMFISAVPVKGGVPHENETSKA